MTKINFILSLHDKLSGFPRKEVEERLNFYSEMIEDRIEEGLSEEEAVAAVGSIDEIAEQIAAELSALKAAKEKTKPKRKLRAWEIVLLVLGAPIWASLLIGAVSVIVSLYAVIWSAIASLWACFGALTACAPAGVAAGILFIIGGNIASGIAMIGAGIVCGGLAIFFFFGCLEATKGVVLLTKKVVIAIKNCFIKKEEAEL